MAEIDGFLFFKVKWPWRGQHRVKKILWNGKFSLWVNCATTALVNTILGPANGYGGLKISSPRFWSVHCLGPPWLLFCFNFYTLKSGIDQWRTRLKNVEENNAMRSRRRQTHKACQIIPRTQQWNFLHFFQEKKSPRNHSFSVVY